MTENKLSKKNDSEQSPTNNVEEVKVEKINDTQNESDDDEGVKSTDSAYDEEKNVLFKKNKEYEDIIKRQQAEFENYRKRTLKEKENFFKYANFELLKELLAIVDNYKRALKIETTDTKIKSFLEGFAMIKKQLDQLLDNNNVKDSTQVGDSMDVHLHQVVQFVDLTVTEKSKVGEEVAEIYQQGYLLHDRVICLATVKVKRKILATKFEDEVENNDNSNQSDGKNLKNTVKDKQHQVDSEKNKNKKIET